MSTGKSTQIRIFSAWVGVNVTNAKQPNNSSNNDYLNRYWSVMQNGISKFSCDTTLTDPGSQTVFTISNKFLLKGTAGTVLTYYFELSPPTVSIVEP